MAICDLCNLEMKSASSCTVGELHADGRAYAVFPHGKDPGWGRAKDRCHDCGVEPGGFHHVGCDVQRCPRCRGQLISCDCRWDELAHEYVDDDLDDDVDDLAELVQLRGDRPVVPRGLVPFAAAVAPLRARHHGQLRALARWSLSIGRPCDSDIAVLCLDVLERHRTEVGVLLRRDTLNDALGCEVPNLVSMLDTRLPEGWVEHAWQVMGWLHEAGELDPASDPIEALLEPLRCGWGLDHEGRKLPPGDDVDFPCQCYLPHDPACPPGKAQFVVGRDAESYKPWIAYAHLRLRSDDPCVSTYRPLFALARRLREDDAVWQVHADELSYAGRIEAKGGTPELWLYRHDPTARRGYEALVLDEGGHPWVPTPDRRRKVGFRWIAGSDSGALHRCGVTRSQFAVAERPEPESPAWMGTGG